MGPLISIIVPVYKVEKYLVRCIKCPSEFIENNKKHSKSNIY